MTEQTPVNFKKLQRREDWPVLLAAFIAEKRDFTWGEADCCLFAAEWVAVCTGHDFAEPFRGKYDSNLGAARILKEQGGVEGIAGARLPEIPKAFAQRGDLVSYNDAVTEERPGWLAMALGVCIGAEAVFLGPEGSLRIPLRLCSKAWAVARPNLENGPLVNASRS